MADYISAGIGAINQTGDPNALFLKVYSGEVLTAFKLATIMDNLVLKRTITSGKSAQFPVTGWLQAHFHTPGQEIKGQMGAQNEQIVVIDDLLLADVFIANIEEAKNHYDIRSIYTRECGLALARSYDNRLIRAAILGARAAANLSPATIAAPAGAVMSQSPGGALGVETIFVKLTYVTASGETTPSTEVSLAQSANNLVSVASPAPAANSNIIGYNVYASTTTGTETLQNSTPIEIGLDWTCPTTGVTTTGRTVPTSNTAAGPAGDSAGTQNIVANVDTDAPTLRTALLDGIKQLDINNVPEEGRYILLKPQQYWLLHKDVTFGYIGNQFFGGEGGLASGKLPMIGGVPIFKSNNFPTGVVNAVSGEQNVYNGTFTNTVALVSHQSSVGLVKLLDLATEMEYQVQRQGTLSVSKMAVGAKYLRPEAVIEIQHT